MKRTTAVILSAVFWIALLVTVCFAEVGSQGKMTITFPTATGDPCINPAFTKTTIAVQAPTASTAYAIIPKTIGKTIYICGLTGSISGTTPTMQIKTGTKTTTECDTDATALTGVMASAAGELVFMMGSGSIMTGNTGSDVCIFTGATSAFQGTVSYIKR